MRASPGHDKLHVFSLQSPSPGHHNLHESSPQQPRVSTPPVVRTSQTCPSSSWRPRPVCGPAWPAACPWRGAWWDRSGTWQLCIYDILEIFSKGPRHPLKRASLGLYDVSLSVFGRKYLNPASTFMFQLGKMWFKFFKCWIISVVSPRLRDHPGVSLV